MEFAQEGDSEDIVTSGAHTDISRLNRAVELEFPHINTTMMTLEDEMMNVPISTRDPRYRLLCDDLEENQRMLEEHTDSILKPSNHLNKQLLLQKIKLM